MSQPPLAPPGLNLGAVKPDPFDPRDHYYTTQLTSVPNSVNLRKDDAAYVSEIYDQGNMGSCTANATAAAFWYEEKFGARAAIWDPAGPSRLFIYWLARGGYKDDSHNIVGVSDNGSFTRDALKGIGSAGVCSENDCPYVDYPAIKKAIKQELPQLQEDSKKFNKEVNKRANPIINKKPSSQAFTNALPHKIAAYYRVDPDRPEVDDGKLSSAQKTEVGVKTLNNLRYCLAENFPVAFSFWFYEDADKVSIFHWEDKVLVLDDVWNREDNPILPNTKPPGDYGGHSVLAIGYDDSKEQVLIQNSWGPTYDDTDGTFWMPYTWIKDFVATFDFWTIRKDKITPIQPPTFWETLQKEIETAAPA
ncbi:MAG: hypothetical protein LQ342_001911 [Letrouitia transgressa]|nr:MAG: hypothetical protein LQ342_001911 [Letrouitia transgressa]